MKLLWWKQSGGRLAWQPNGPGFLKKQPTVLKEMEAVNKVSTALRLAQTLT